ncbi:MAG: tetratricopeptide repeat protein [Candidatus Eisenbacteria bacterium]
MSMRETTQTVGQRRKRLFLSWQWPALLAVLLIGLVLRVAYFRQIAEEPDFAVPLVDAGFNDYWARGLATGEWQPPHGKADPLIRESPYLRQPGYPYFLSLVYLLFGTGYHVPRIIQMGLGLVSALLAFLFARRLYGPGVALILAAFMSFYWIFIFFEGELLSLALLICLFCLLLYILTKWIETHKTRYPFIAGLVLGLACLVRPTVLTFLPVLVFWSLWVTRRNGRLRTGLFTVVGLLMGTALSIAPATVRNYRVAKDFVLISSNGGINLFIGNNEAATGLFSRNVPGFGEFGNCFDYPAIVRNLEQHVGRRLKASEVSAYFTREALRFIRENPIGFAKLTAKKAGLFWGSREITHNKAVWCARQNSSVLRNTPGNFSVVLALGAVGLGLMLLDRRRERTGREESATISANRKWEMSVLLLGLVVVYFLSVLPFFSTSRYRVPVIPFLLLFAAYGVWRICVFIWTRDLRRGFAWLAVVAVLYGSHVLAGAGAGERRGDLVKWHKERAMAYNALQRIDDAIREYRLALDCDPSDFEAYSGLGTCFYKVGHLEEAVRYLTKAVELKPDYADGHYNLGLAHAARKNLDKAGKHYLRALQIEPDLVAAHVNMGVMLTRQGKLDEAVEHLRAAVRMQSGHPLARLQLGIALSRQGKHEEAIEHLSIAADLAPNNLNAWIHLGENYAEVGRFGRAVSATEKAFLLARAAGKDELARSISSRIQLYRKNNPMSSVVEGGR